VLPVEVEGIPKRLFFLRSSDLPALEASADSGADSAEAAFIAPLDNVAWNRDMLRQLFGFDYRWEVYTPKAKRLYGYYVLPVLYGDRFIARVEPILDKKSQFLRIAGWWWEKRIRPNAAMKDAIAACVAEFARYLGANRVALDGAASADRRLSAILGR
jgi:uncharacterized protein YcaQ